MGIELDFEGKLNVSDVDLVAPEIVVRDIANQLESKSYGFVEGVVEPYTGNIESYLTVSGLSTLATLDAPIEKEYNIQNDLGEIGYTYSKFELYLKAIKLPHYKFRVLFFGYDIGGYPVKVTIEQSIVNTIYGSSSTRKVKNREELEDLINRVLCSSRVVEIMQGLINASIIEQSREKDLESREIEE